jgi:hypothetical protein
VRGEQDRPPRDGRLPRPDEVAHRTRRGHVEAERRLVEEQDPGVVHETAGEVQLLALARGERGDLLVSLLHQTHGLDELVHPTPPLADGQAVELAEHPQLLAHLEQAIPRLLATRHDVHDPAHLGGLARDVEAEHARGALGRQQERGQDLDERRLAGAIGAQQAEQLTRRDLEVDAIERDDGCRLRLVDTPNAPDVDGRGTGGWRPG